MKDNKIVKETDNDRCYTVYMHTAPNGKRYIGITSKNPPEKRWGKNGYAYKPNKHFWNAIQKYGWNKFNHEILFENLTKKEAEEKEIELIAFYNSCDGNYGYNIEHGGNCTGTHSEETKNKIREKRIGKKHSEETKKKLSDERKIPVCQYDLEGNFLKRYDGILDGSVATGVESGNISACCKNKIKTSGGFIWQYDGVELTLENLLWHSSDDNKVAVCQYSLSGGFIKKYKSSTEASIEVAVNNSLIVECCKGHRKTGRGYIWRYADEELTQQHINWCNNKKNEKTPVLQYSLCCELIGSFDGIQIASRLTGIDPSTIVKCCKGRQKTAGGYIWRYANDENNEFGQAV